MGKDYGLTTRLKIRPKFRPTWEGIVEQWALAYCITHEWRTLPEFDRDDLSQEAFLIFSLVCDRYWEVRDAPHFMALFKICLINRINRLSNLRTKRFKKGDIPVSMLVMGEPDEDRDMAILEGVCEGHFDEVEARSLINDVGPINTLYNQLVEPEARHRYRRSEGVRETTNEFLCRLTNNDPALVDMVAIVTAWVKGESCTKSTTR